MLSIPQTSLKGERFNSYVEELRQFASGYGMRYGDPDDLHGLVAGLEDNEGFREECGSMLRSMVYRERGKAPPSELLSIAATAWGGTEVSNAGESLQEPIREVLRFVSGVMNGPRRNVAAPLDRDVAPWVVTSGDVGDVVEAETAVTSGAATGQIVVVEEEPPSRAVNVDREIARLERESGDVMRYLELLGRRAAAEEVQTQLILNQPPSSHVVLQAKLASAPAEQVVAASPYDPWDENSELQRELRQFAAEREARLVARRAAPEEQPLQSRLLHKAEAALCRLTGVDLAERRSRGQHSS